MSSTAAPSYNLHFLYFTFLWWVSFLVYPMWYVPQPAAMRPALCLALFACLVAGVFLFRWVVRYAQRCEYSYEPVWADQTFFAVLFPILTLLHLPFLPQPVITGLDMIDHVSVPGLVAAKVLKAATGVTVIPSQFLFLTFSIILCTLFLRRKPGAPDIRQQWKLPSCWTTGTTGVLLLILAFITLLYSYVVYKSALPDRFGDLDTIFRYPPVSKMMLIPLFLLFGLHDWIGNTLQLLFFYAAAVYLHALVRMFAPVTAARLAVIFFLLLPPIFHYGNTHLLEGGTLFFTIASYYHWVRFFEKRAGNDLIWAILLTTTGCLYKHPLVSVIPAVGLMLCVDFLKTFRQRKIVDYIVPFVGVVIPAATFQLYMKLASFNSDLPDKLVIPDWFRLSENLRAVVEGVTLPVALLFLAGLVYLLIARTRLTVYLLCIILPHYAMTCMSAAYANVRQALPYYYGMMIAAAVFLEAVVKNPAWLRQAFFYGVIPLYLAWASLLKDRVYDHTEIGRAMGDTSYINFSNWNDSYVPYDAVMADLKDRTQPGDIIFAPMGNEPSQFYLAKNGIDDRTYIRSIIQPGVQEALGSLDTLLRYCRENGYNWLLLPRGKWIYQYANDTAVFEPLFTSPPEGFQLVEIYHNGNVEVGLWNIQ